MRNLERAEGVVLTDSLSHGVSSTEQDTYVYSSSAF